MSEEQKFTRLKGLYHGNDVAFAGSPKLNDKGELKVFGMHDSERTANPYEEPLPSPPEAP